MDLEKVTVSGMLMGVGHYTDYQSGSLLGVQLDLGSRSESGRFVTRTIKVLGAKQADFVNFLDDVVTLELDNVTISSYMAGNRPALSVKAGNATIKEA